MAISNAILNTLKTQDSINQKSAVAYQKTFPRMSQQQRNLEQSYVEAKLMNDMASDIYWYSDNPKEEASAYQLGKIIHTLVPSISEEVAIKNYRSIIRNAVGDDMDAGSVLSLAGNKIAQGVDDIATGLGHTLWLVNMGNLKNKSEEEIKALSDAETKRIEEAQKRHKRTDIYNEEFENFLEKTILSASDFIPSHLASWVPEAIGYALTFATGVPAFKTMGRAFSTAVAGILEGGSASMQAQLAGADIDTQRAIFATVGLINGSLEVFGNIGERKVTDAFAQAVKLNKEIGGLGSYTINKTVRDIFKESAIDYGIGLIAEPATEGLQEWVSMYAMNLASKWEQQNRGKKWDDYFTYTKEEMADAVKETVLSTFRGQLLLGATEGTINLAKSYKNGELRILKNAGNFTDTSNSSFTTLTKGILANNGTVKRDVEEIFDKKGNKTTKEKNWSPIKIFDTSVGMIPTTVEEANKVGYVRKQDNSEFSAVNVEKSYFTPDANNNINKEQANKKVFNLLEKDLQQNNIQYGITEDGKIVVAENQVGDVIQSLISENYEEFKGIEERDVDKQVQPEKVEGKEQKVEKAKEYTVTIGNENIVFSTDNSQTFEQWSGERTVERQMQEQALRNQKYQEELEGLRTERRKSIESLINSSKTSQEKYDTFIRNIRNTLSSQKIKGSELNSEIKSSVSMFNKFHDSAKQAVELGIKNGKFREGSNVEDVTNAVNYGIIQSVAKIGRKVGKTLSWANDHIIVESDTKTTMTNGKSVYGYSYWTDGSTDANGNLIQYKNFKDLKNQDNADFHIALTQLLDQSTGIHEIGHMFLSLGEEKLLNDAQFKKAFGQFIAEDGGTIGDSTHEAFAMKLEDYVNNGIADNTSMRSIFNNVLDAMRDIYNSIKNFLTDDQQDFFDRIFNDRDFEDFSGVSATSDEIVETGVRNKIVENQNDYEDTLQENFETNPSIDIDLLKGYHDVPEKGTEAYKQWKNGIEEFANDIRKNLRDKDGLDIINKALGLTPIKNVNKDYNHGVGIYVGSNGVLQKSIGQQDFIKAEYGEDGKLTKEFAHKMDLSALLHAIVLRQDSVAWGLFSEENDIEQQNSLTFDARENLDIDKVTSLMETITSELENNGYPKDGVGYIPYEDGFSIVNFYAFDKNSDFQEFISPIVDKWTTENYKEAIEYTSTKYSSDNSQYEISGLAEVKWGEDNKNGFKTFEWNVGQNEESTFRQVRNELLANGIQETYNKWSEKWGNAGTIPTGNQEIDSKLAKLSQEGLRQWTDTESKLRMDSSNFDSEGNHLAPNGKKSNLSYFQWVQVRTQNFINWFGDWINDKENASKIVDENGEPLQVYHGTSEQFDEFNPELIGKTTGNKGIFGKGFYFSKSYKYASWYFDRLKTGNGDVMYCFLNIRKPFYWENNSLDDSLKGSFPSDRITENGLLPIIIDYDIEKFTNALVKNNYDGVVYEYDSSKGSITERRFGEPVSEIVVFNSNQIKSSENNSGDFKVDNNSIRMKSGYEMESINTALENGQIVNPIEYERRYRDSEWVQADILALKVQKDSSLIWAKNALKRAIDDYLEGQPVVYSELTDADWDKIVRNWNRIAQERKGIEFDGKDPVKVAKRLVAWDNAFTDENQTKRVWYHQFTDDSAKQRDKRSREAIMQLARKANDTGLLDDKITYSDGTIASRKYRFLDEIVQQSYKDKGYRTTRVNEAIWNGARQEIQNNIDELMKMDRALDYDASGRVLNEINVEEGEYEEEYKGFTARQIRLARVKAETAQNEANEAVAKLRDSVVEVQRLNEELNQNVEELKPVAERLGIEVAENSNVQSIVDDINARLNELDKNSQKTVKNAVKKIMSIQSKLDTTIETNAELRGTISLQNKSIEMADREKARYQKQISKLTANLDKSFDKLYSLKEVSKQEKSELKASLKSTQDKLANVIKKYDKQVSKNEALSSSYKQSLSDLRKTNTRLQQAIVQVEQLKEKNSNLKDDINAKNNEIRALNKEIATYISDIQKLENENIKLENQKQAIKLKYANLVLNRRIEKSRQDWLKKFNAKSGDADKQRNMSVFAQNFFAREFTPFDIPQTMFDALPNTLNALEQIGLMQGNSVVGGFDDIPVQFFKMINEAINQDRASSIEEAKARITERKEFAQKIVGDVSADLNTELTKAEEDEAQNLYLNDDKYSTIEDARKEILKRKFKQEVTKNYTGTPEMLKELKSLKYNKEKGINVHNSVLFNNFTSFGNMLKSVSKTLYNDFFNGVKEVKNKRGEVIVEARAGINEVTDNSLIGSEKRKSDVNARNMELLGVDKKGYEKFLKTVTQTVETRKLNVAQIPQSLLEQSNFVNYIDTDTYDANFVNNKLTLSNVIAIYEHSRENDDIPHITGAGKVPALEVAWIVNEFEKTDGVFHQYKALADSYQQAYSERFNEIAKISNEVYGKSLQKVDVYSPLNSADDDDDISMINSFNNEGKQTGYNTGLRIGQKSFQQERIGGDNPISLNYVEDLDRVIDSQEYFIAGAKFFKDWNEVMYGDGQLKKSIEVQFGKNQADTIIKGMKACRNAPNADYLNSLNGYASALRNNLALSSLAFNVSSTLQQPSVWALGQRLHGFGRMTEATKKAFSMGAKNFMKYVDEMSPQIKASSSMTIMYAKQALYNSSIYSKIKHIAELGMKPIEYLDHLNRCIIWQAGFDKYMSMVDANGNKMYTEAESSRLATQDCLDVNSSTQAKDNALIYTDNSPYWKSILMFTNQQNKQWNLLLGEKGLMATEHRTKEFISTMMSLAMASTLVLLAKGKLQNNRDDEEDWLKDLAKDYAMEGVNNVPILGEWISDTVYGYNNIDSNIVMSMTKLIMDTIKDSDEKGKKLFIDSKNIVNDFASLFGAPKVPLNNLYNVLFEDGEFVGQDFSAVRLSKFMSTEWYEFFMESMK